MDYDAVIFGLLFGSSTILAGQLLGIAFACGLNLYATVALLALASRLGIVAELPPGMSGLENGIVIGMAASLFVIEFVVDRIRYVGSAWEAVHTLIRPAAAGLLAWLALQTMPPYLQLAGAAGATLMAFGTHASKAGLRLILSTRPALTRRSGRQRQLILAAVSLLEDSVAIGVVAVTLLYPTSAIMVVGVVVLLLLLTGPRLWRAALLGLLAVRARIRVFFGIPGWRTRDQLPRRVRNVIPVEPLGRSPARAMSAAVTGLPRIGSFRNGWLVFTCDGPRFVYRSFFGTQSTPLPHAATVQLRAGILTDVIDVRTSGSGRGFTLFLLKDGPPVRVAMAELTSVHA